MINERREEREVSQNQCIFRSEEVLLDSGGHGEDGQAVCLETDCRQDVLHPGWPHQSGFIATFATRDRQSPGTFPLADVLFAKTAFTESRQHLAETAEDHALGPLS